MAFAGGVVIIQAEDQADAEVIPAQDPLVVSTLVTDELARFSPEVE